MVRVGAAPVRLRDPLRVADFRRLVTALAVSNVGSWLYATVLIVYVYDRTHSATWVGLVTVARMAPSVVCGPYTGVVAERFERIRLMVVLDLLSALLTGGLAVLAYLHGPVPVLLVLAGVAGVLLRVYDPAVSAVTPELVDAGQLAAANTLVNTITQGAILVGPGIGAVLLALGSPAAGFVVNSASFLVSAAVVGRIRLRSAPVDVTVGGSVGPVGQILVGIRALLATPPARLLAAYSIGASFVYGTDTVLLVAVARDRLGLGTSGFGALMAVQGAGAIAGALLVPRLAARPRLAGLIIAGVIAYTVPTLAYLVVHDPELGLPIQLIRGAGTMVLDVLAVTALQRSVPKDTLARVFGAFFTLVIVAITLGALVTPLLLATLGLDGTLIVAGGLLPALGLLGWIPLVRMDRANAGELRSLQEQVVLLRKAAILKPAAQAVLERLAAEATWEEVEAGTAVVSQGEAADAFYVIAEGHLSVTQHDHELVRLAPGEYFGEIGLLHRVARTATVRALDRCRLLRVSGDAFVDAMTQDLASPTLLEMVGTRLARSAPPAAAPVLPEAAV